jgi:hypothetical protein
LFSANLLFGDVVFLSNSESWVIVKGRIDRAAHFGKKPQGAAGVGEEDIAR